MNPVVIIDDRKKWMINEDKHYKCMTFCNKYKQCTTRVGLDCKIFGGNIIPKIRD